MIPKNKIEGACDQCCNFGLGLKVHNDTLKRSLFKAGVSFAEKELENLAIEFAEWILQHKDPSFGIIGGYKCPNKWMDTIQGNRIDYTTKELFEIFKKENYE